MTNTGRSSEAGSPRGLPTGSVTFLFTDVEGSSRRWDAHGDVMDAAIKRHDAILRDTIATHHGYVFKTVGDAFCAAFWQATDAVNASAAAQRALYDEDFSAVGGLRVRMGLHVGDASERDGDYFGPAVNRVARLAAIGHGGQVLLSDAARGLVHHALPSGASLIDFGFRRLKDLTQPERVWQLTVEGLPDTFPPLNSLDARANNLPFQSTSLRGRETDLREIEELVCSMRMVTLVGSGGIGKTRLSVQAGADLLDRFRDGVWFVEFASIVDSAVVAESTAATVGASMTADRSPIDAITDHLRYKQALLILDNCEHVVEPAADLSKAILERCGEIRILATSRQALGVTGEIAHRVSSLAVPEGSTALGADEAARYGAVALFADRARAVNSRFSLTDENAGAVAEVCRRLDGIPLAIELAAARVKVLSVSRLASSLHDRLHLLTGGARTALPRQRTLRALIDWSYDLLSAPEQMLFRRTALFAGGFTLDAAAAVCTGDGLDGNDVLDLLSSLVDKSLIVPGIGADTERFGLLESTREYGLEKLDEFGERDGLASAYASYFSERALALEAGMLPREVSNLLEPDIDNYRAVLTWALERRNDPILGGRLVGALSPMWSRGPRSEGLRWAAAALEVLGSGTPDEVAARLWLIVAEVSEGQRSHDASEHAEVLFTRIGDKRRLAIALYYAGFSSYQLGKYEEAEDAYRRALALARDIGDQSRVASSLNGLASVLFIRGDRDGPRQCYAEALAAHAATDNERGRSAVLGNLAELEFAEGNVAQAAVYGAESLAIDAKDGTAASAAISYNNMCAYRVRLGEIDRARSDGRQGVRRAREAQSTMHAAIALQHLALIGAMTGNAVSAARLVGYVDKIYREEGAQREPTETWSYQALMTSLNEQVPGAELPALIASGASWPEDRAVEEALRL